MQAEGCQCKHTARDIVSRYVQREVLTERPSESSAACADLPLTARSEQQPVQILSGTVSDPEASCRR